MVAGQGVINAVSFKRGKTQIRLTVEEEVTLRIAQLRYPYSRATALPQGQELALAAGEPDGLISLPNRGSQENVGHAHPTRLYVVFEFAKKKLHITYTVMINSSIALLYRL